MERLAYQPAAAVAHTVAEHFRHHLGAAGPDAPTIERIISAAFWASLRREEGRIPKISLAFLPPTAAGNPLLVERPLPLDPAILTRLAPAVERPGIHLGVWHDEGGTELHVWGATRTIANPRGHLQPPTHYRVHTTSASAAPSMWSFAK